ncbi:MAG TPA: DUF4340 domain-containing protein [Anaerolineae bacterium]|nr:DUF4340 domain-containing protein [Anaerolineae bacterium]
MNRRNQILAGVLVLQLVLVAVLFWPRHKGGAAGQSLFPGVEPGQVTSLKVTQSGREPVEVDRSGSGWELAGTDGYPAISGTVTAAIDQIVTLTADRAVATNPSSHKRLKVAEDDYERLAEFELDGGTRHRLFLGTSPSYGTTYVRVEGQNEVYLAGLTSSDLGGNPSAWIDTTYLTVTQDLVTGLTLRNRQGTFEFAKSGTSWTMTGIEVGETLDASKVTTILSTISSLRMVEPLGKAEKPEYGLAEPLAVLEVTTADKTYTLRVGALAPDGSSYVAGSSESPYFVRISQYTLSRLVDNGRDFFLVQPTEVPSVEPTSAP